MIPFLTENSTKILLKKGKSTGKNNMIFNLLLTDPDNIPDGYGVPSTAPLWVILLAFIATIVTVCATYTIYKLYKKAYPESKSHTKILILIITVTLILIALYILIACIGYKETN